MRPGLSLLLVLAAICCARAEWTLQKWNELGALEVRRRCLGRRGLVGWTNHPCQRRFFSVRRLCLSCHRQSARRTGSLFRRRSPRWVPFAGSNGGYFHKDFTPLGLAVSAGETLHPFERAKLLSGVLAVRKGRIELVRSGKFKAGPDVQDALQAGPWLVEKGTPVSGLNDARLARRTIVANDGKGHWALVAVSPVTLADAARVLCLKGILGPLTIANALNFDGGSSTALRASSEGGILIDITSFGPVRNYLAIVRSPAIVSDWIILLSRAVSIPLFFRHANPP